MLRETTLRMIQCDTDGCDEFFLCNLGLADTIRIAAQAGWEQLYADGWLCPMCAEVHLDAARQTRR